MVVCSSRRKGSENAPRELGGIGAQVSDVARRNGALAPAFRPVRFLLNGEHIGNYLLGVPSGNCNNIDLVEFMRRRPAWVVHDLGPVVGAGPMYEVAVESAEHAAIEVDGHAKGRRRLVAGTATGRLSSSRLPASPMASPTGSSTARPSRAGN